MPLMRMLLEVALAVVRAARWTVETRGGRVVAALLVVGAVVFSLAGEDPTIRTGKWRGFAGAVAPWEGPIRLESTRDGQVRCHVEGWTGTASGNGWVFRGDATVRSTSCEGRIDDDGGLSVTMDLRMEWHGKIKGWDSDWERIDGYGDCSGPLGGSLGTGEGEWQAQCTNEKYEWTTGLRWTLEPPAP